MIFFPFRRKVYKTTLSIDEIFSRLQKNTSLSNANTGEEDDKSVALEMTQATDSFIIGKSTGGKKPGLMDAGAVVKGKLKGGNGFTHATITIGPRSFLLPGFSFLVAIPALYFGVTKYDFLTFTLAILLLVLIYSDMISKFNRLYDQYANIIDRVFEDKAA